MRQIKPEPILKPRLSATRSTLHELQKIQSMDAILQDFATVPGSVQSTNQFQTSINGIPLTFGGASVLVDGIDAGRVDLNGTSKVLGRIESRITAFLWTVFRKFKSWSNYSAQYGNALSAVINPITKSGTNELHGSVFEYFRNDEA